jgi:hypothetical protein
MYKCWSEDKRGSGPGHNDTYRNYGPAIVESGMWWYAQFWHEKYYHREDGPFSVSSFGVVSNLNMDDTEDNYYRQVYHLMRARK